MITDDRRCVGCGYNLRGLPLMGSCPECGRAVRSTEAIDEPLSNMPAPVVRAYRRGMVAVVVILILSLGVQAGAPLWPLSMKWWAATIVLASAAWVIAVILATPAFDLEQAAWHGFSRAGRLRRFAQAAQLGWVLLAIAQLGLILTAAGVPALRSFWMAAAVTGLVAGTAGMMLLALVFQNLAEWTRDETAGHVLNGFFWTAPFAVAGSILNLPTLWQVLLAILEFVAVILLLAGVIMLARSVHLAVYHAEDLEERRLAARERERSRE